MGAVASTTGHDHLPAADFDRISSLVGETIGIRLTPQKRLMVESRLDGLCAPRVAEAISFGRGMS